MKIKVLSIPFFCSKVLFAEGNNIFIHDFIEQGFSIQRLRINSDEICLSISIVIVGELIKLFVKVFPDVCFHLWHILRTDCTLKHFLLFVSLYNYFNKVIYCSLLKILSCKLLTTEDVVLLLEQLVLICIDCQYFLALGMNDLLKLCN